MSSDPNGFGKGGMPTQFMSPSGGGAGIGGQGWPQQAGSAGPPNFGGGKGQMGWPSHQWGGQGETLGVDCSGSGDQGGWSGGQDGHHLVAIKKEGRWALTAAAQMKECGLIKAGSLRAEGKAGGGWSRVGISRWGQGPLGVTKAEERSVSIAAAQLKAEGGWTPPSGGEGPGTPFGSGPKEGGGATKWRGRTRAPGVDYGGSGAGGPTPETSFSFPGSNGGGGIPGPAEGSSLTETSMVSSNTDDQGDSTTEVSGVSSGNGDGESTTTESSGVPVALEIRSHRLP
ncbi:hypothetical protein GQ600_21065 [Phytophthora cactorum]|nr:hypothetical protein GQ600_21065 [Phytophthora cactorum]